MSVLLYTLGLEPPGRFSDVKSAGVCGRYSWQLKVTRDPDLTWQRSWGEHGWNHWPLGGIRGQNSVVEPLMLQFMLMVLLKSAPRPSNAPAAWQPKLPEAWMGLMIRLSSLYKKQADCTVVNTELFCYKWTLHESVNSSPEYDSG